MSDYERLIEHAFPLKQTSLTSVHEKLCHSGHIKAIHLWPARRPLSACRSTILATLLPDPGIHEQRQQLCDMIGGKITHKIERKKMPNGQTVERDKEVVENGILRWGLEFENANIIEKLRSQILKNNGGKPIRFFDPFSGGGAIPLEAMRLGCDITANDINPVAWFVLRCTLEFPQKFSSLLCELPEVILQNDSFMSKFYRNHPHLVGRTVPTKKQLDQPQKDLFVNHSEDNKRTPKASLSWHVRAWGEWIFDQARNDLIKFFPVYADFEAIDIINPKAFEKQETQLAPVKADGMSNVDELNKNFTREYLSEKRNPRWVAKPSLAYLWARTVKCKNCRTNLPLLKSSWLQRKNTKRTLLEMTPSSDNLNIIYSIKQNVPVVGSNAAQKREYDKKVGLGTMSRAGAKCPLCDTIMTMEDIRLEGQAGRVDIIMTSVVVAGQKGKEFRLPTDKEREYAINLDKQIENISSEIPFGMPDEPTPKGGGRKASRGFSIQGYGLMKWSQLYTPRQLLTIATFVKYIRKAHTQMVKKGYNSEFTEAVVSYLACVLNKVADYNSSLVAWQPGGSKGANTFQRWALPMKWDFIENNILVSDSGGWKAVLDWVTEPIDEALKHATILALPPQILMQSALTYKGTADLIVTDPPYYDSIPYSDCMDFFYVWLRRTLNGISSKYDAAFKNPLSPKWDQGSNDGEIIDDDSRQGGDSNKSKAVYEDGMFRAFKVCHDTLTNEGRLVIVFAHKDPNAWETLVSAMIRAGFVVEGSWPIQTEMGNRTRAMSSAALASSVWMVCRKRQVSSTPGWDNNVILEMNEKINSRLREYWDAGIRGPDFVWAATGPALEAYSKHYIVKKADDPNTILTVSEFLNRVRRIVVDFVVGRVLSGDDNSASSESIAERLDDPTAYYLLHRHDFGMEDAPSGSCILYAVSCGLSDKELADTWDLITFTKGSTLETENESNEEIEEPESEEQSGNKVKLKVWYQRKSQSMGFQAPGGKPIPLIDRIHRLMYLWKEGDVHKVDEYLDETNLRKNELFKRLLQSVIELAQHASEERIMMEKISNHIHGKGTVREDLTLYQSEEISQNKES